MYTDVVDSDINYTKDKSQKLKKACDDFEALFLSKMFETMRNTTLSDDKDGLIKKSQGEKIFTQMLDSQVAQDFTKNRSMGLSDMLYNSMSKYVEADKSSNGNNFPDGKKSTGTTDGFLQLRQQLNGTDVASDMLTK